MCRGFCVSDSAQVELESERVLAPGDRLSLLKLQGNPVVSEVPSYRKTLVAGRGLHSSTSQLNLGACCGIGGARRGCEARVRGVLGGV